MSRTRSKGDMDFYVADRETGAPLCQCFGTGIREQYNYFTREYEPQRK